MAERPSSLPREPGQPEPHRSDAHKPRRGDDVESWLKRQRDAWNRTGDRPEFQVIDGMLDRYRECADYGLTLRPEDDEAGDP